MGSASIGSWLCSDWLKLPTDRANRRRAREILEPPVGFLSDDKAIMKNSLVAATLWTGLMCSAALSGATPRIQFEQTVYDFGKTAQVATVSGVFAFKNAGDGILKVEPPRTSCGCAVAALKSDTLQPGEAGELRFTLHLGQVKTQFDKRITVKSNDPQTPEVSLAIKADYTPLYEVKPLTLAPQLAFGVDETTLYSTLTRTDGKPLRLARLDASQPWITATVEPGATADEGTARVRVTLQREGRPRRFNEFVHVYAAGQTNAPVSSISLYGQFLGEVALSPESLYWSVTEGAAAAPERPETQVTRRVTIRSSDGRRLAVKNPQSTIKGLKVELVPMEVGKSYELVARLEAVPTRTVSGKVSFETSVAAQPVMEVPVIVHVSKP